MPAPTPLISEEEFLALPETHERLELIDGEVYPSPSPVAAHQALVLDLGSELRLWARRSPPASVGLAPLDVRLAPGRIVQPDLFVLLGGAPPREGIVHGVPELVVEVLSERRGYDRLTKRLIYAEAGVREYWMVDRWRGVIEVAHGLTTVAEVEETLESALLPGFTLDVKALFRG